MLRSLSLSLSRSLALSLSQHNRTTTRDLEQVLLRKFLEHATLELDKVVRYHQGEERTTVAIDRYIERDHLTEQNKCMDHCQYK